MEIDGPPRERAYGVQRKAIELGRQSVCVVQEFLFLPSSAVVAGTNLRQNRPHSKPHSCRVHLISSLIYFFGVNNYTMPSELNPSGTFNVA